MSQRPCVSVVVVTYNSGETIGACLSTLSGNAQGWIESVTVVDNSSADDSCERVANVADVRLIKNDSNLGFSRACNIGAAHARGDYLLFLNPDARIESHAVDELVRFMDARKKAGCSGPVILDDKGKPDPACRRGFPTPWNALGRLFFFEKLFPTSRTFSSYTLPWLGFDREAIVDCVSGACLLIRRVDFERLQGFDEDYFLFGEDIDLCKRLSELGRETWFIPAARVIHVGGHSMRQASDRANSEFYRAMRLYMAKHWRALPRWFYGMIHLGIGFRAWLERYIGH